MSQNARIRNEWIQSTERVQITAAKTHHPHSQQYSIIGDSRFRNRLNGSLPWFPKYERSHVRTMRDRYWLSSIPVLQAFNLTEPNGQHVGERFGSLDGQLHVQPVGALLKYQFGIAAEQRDRRYLLAAHR